MEEKNESNNSNMKVLKIVSIIPYAILAINILFILIIIFVPVSNKDGAVLLIPVLSIFLSQYITIAVSIVGIILCIRSKIKYKSKVDIYLLLNLLSLALGLLKHKIFIFNIKNAGV